MSIRPYAKALVAIAGAAGVALADGSITPAEVCLAIVTVGGVYGIRNDTELDRDRN